MTKLTYITLLCFSFLFFIGCSKNDEDSDEANTLLGKWELVSWSLKTPIDLNNDGETSTEFNPGCLAGSFYEFEDTLNGSVFNSASVSYNTRIEEGELIYMTACSTSSEITPKSITYSQDSNVLEVVEDDLIYTLTLENDHLLLHIENGFIATDIDSQTVTIEEDVTYVFEKI